MKVLLGVSNRHIHIKREDFEKIFKEKELKNIKELVQPHQYVSPLFVDIKTEKNIIKGVRVLGPIRDYTQVELSKSDSIYLGIDSPVAESGDLENAAEVEIIGPCGSIKRKSAIIADRHIHVTKKMKEKYGLEGIEEVSVLFEGEKTTIFSNVKLKVCPEANFELHLDTDDANGALLKTGDYGTIIMKQ